jgi:glycosyltransferase involved in cell wall biosynthesis
VLAQDCGDIELLVVDDGSTDNSTEVVRSLNDRRIRLLGQKNRGVSVARNHAVHESQADWIAFLDADDEWLAGFLRSVLTTVSQHPDADLVFTNVYDPGIRRNRISNDWPEGYTQDLFQMCLQNHGHSIKTSAVAIRRKVMLEQGAFLPGVRFGEDRELWARLAFTSRLYYIPQALAVYNSETPGSIMSRKRDLAFYPPRAAETIKDWDRRDKIPPYLKDSARRWANEMYLTQAQRLIAVGEPTRARSVLEQNCEPRYCDTERYRKLLLLSHAPRFATSKIVQMRDVLRRFRLA